MIDREPRPAHPADAPQEPAERHQSAAHIARGAFASLSTQPFTWATSLASVVLVPRLLGADGLGRFSIAWTIGSMAGLVAAGGLRPFITRRVATQPESAATYAWAGFVVTAVSSVCMAALTLPVITLFADPAIDISLVAMALFGALLWSAQGIITGVLMSLGRHTRYALSSASFTIVGTSAGLTALLLGGGPHGYGLALLAGWSTMTVVLWYGSGLRITRSAVQPRLFREILFGGVPFMSANLALSVRGESDVVLTGLLLQPGVAGWLAAAYRIINITVFIPAALATPLLPALTQARGLPGRFRAILSGSLATTLLLVVPVSGTIFALAPIIPRVLGWPAELEHSVPLMRILAFQQVLIAVDMMLSIGLIALGLERKWLRVAIAGAVFNPALNLAAIPLAQLLTANGAVGAAIVEVVTETLFLGGALILMPRGMLGRPELANAGRVLICGLVFVGTVTALLPIGWILALGAGGVTYAVLAALLGLLRIRQLRDLRVALRAA